MKTLARSDWLLLWHIKITKILLTWSLSRIICRRVYRGGGGEVDLVRGRDLYASPIWEYFTEAGPCRSATTCFIFPIFPTIYAGVCYFACPIELGPNGIKRNLGLLRVDHTYEKPYLKSAIQHLKCDIKRGENYIWDPWLSISGNQCNYRNEQSTF